MVGESKILTVSYGTFSCTLEGFDDPFSTMRGIAEYFRDLAADDRYFGAEPPTPDAEMLHRIAEREVQRRVEARIQDDGIVLRQMEKAAPAVAAPAASEEDSDDEDAGEAAHADATAEDIAEDGAGDTELTAADQDPGEGDAFFAAEPEAEVEVEVEDEEPTPIETYTDDSIAAKLQRIRAVVSKAPTFDDEPAEAQETAYAGSAYDAGLADAFASDDDFAAEEPADTAEDEDWTDDQIGTPAFDAEEEGPETLEQSIEAHDFDAADDGAAEETGVAFLDDAGLAAADIDDTETGADEVADDELTEAEDVAEDALAEAETEAPAAEDEPAEVFAETETDAETEESAAADEPAEVLAETGTETEAEDDSDVIAAVTAAWDQFSVSAETDEEENTTQADASGDEALAARIVQLKSAFATGSTDTEQPLAAPADLQAAFDDVAEDSFEAEAEEAEEELAEDSDDDQALEAVSADDEDLDFESTLTAEDEADLMHALDAAETGEGADEDENIFAEDDDDLAAQTEEDEFAAEAEEDEDLAAEADEGFGDDFDERAEDEDHPASARDRLAAIPPEQTGDTAFDRILEETNSQLDDTESTRRRSAIAHLKAAVAATKADRLIRRTPEEEDAEEQSQYREDLAKVVRPRHVEGRATERPRMPDPDARPSPLVLVSELRVDKTEGGEERAPVGIRPRRVMTREIDLDTVGEGSTDPNFAEFADRMGATELPDLMEAAAAYAAFVEGRREFSRPELMRRVASFKGGTDFTREAGLRSFGHLLREGKIRKLKRGQFTIPEATRFNPEARIAGE